MTFWERAQLADGGCLIWQEGKTTGGYGEYNLPGRRTVYAHRYAWVLSFGEIPEGMFVLHRCDTPACINPDHLFLGTHADNMQDCAAKGRFNRALNPDKVRELRQRRQNGESYRAIARSMGTTHATVRLADLGITWGHVDA